MSDPGLREAYLEHEPDLLRFLSLRFGLPELAADIAHDLYLRLCRPDASVQVRDRRAYLFSMAANLATDRLRVERRRSEILAEVGNAVWPGTDELSPERHALARAELAEMKATIDALPARCREVFYLTRYEGRSQAEVADALGIGITTVYKDLKAAMAALVAARRRFHDQSADAQPGDDAHRIE